MQVIKSSKNSAKTFVRLSSAIFLALSINVYAVDKVYTASAIGSDGSSGTVSFTIDSGIAAAGSSITNVGAAGTVCGAGAANLKAFSLTMSGGSLASPQTWTCAQIVVFLCSGSAGATTPCGTDLKFSANNGANAFGAGGSTRQAPTNWGSPAAIITWGAVNLPTVSAPIDFSFNHKPVETFASEIETK